MQIFEGRLCPPPQGHITIVVSRFNSTITDGLLAGAVWKLRQHDVHENDIRIVRVPGAYELPFVADYVAHDPECLAVICLGAIIKGDTPHDQHISRYVSMALGEIARQTKTIVIFGVLTCDTLEQAKARSGAVESPKDKAVDAAPGNKGIEAAEAALEMIDLMDELPLCEKPSPLDMLTDMIKQGQTGSDDTQVSVKISSAPLQDLKEMLKERQAKLQKKAVKKTVKKTAKKKGKKK